MPHTAELVEENLITDNDTVVYLNDIDIEMLHDDMEAVSNDPFLKINKDRKSVV